MNKNKANFLKLGNKIVFKNATGGIDYELLQQQVYVVEIDRMTDELMLKTSTNLALPDKIFSTKKEDTLINKVLFKYNKIKTGVMGVMLEGLKGSGKTITAKRIAMDSNLPIILIDNSVAPYYLKKLFKQLDGIDACVIFDEIDKMQKDHDDSFLLTTLDGIDTSSRKLVIFTCNDKRYINEYLKDRCSRIRYWVEFKELSCNMIQTILQDKLKDKSKIKDITDFILKTFKFITFDNVIAFIDEVNDNPNDTLDDLFNDMNLSKR